MRVEVSGKQFVFPRQCACCGRFPGSRLTISGSERNRNSRTEGWIWDIPYCVQCVSHVKAVDRIFIGGLSIVALFGICSFIVGFVLTSWLSGLGFFAATTALVTGAVWILLSAVKIGQHEQCCTAFRAITYLGSAGAIHSFDFRSKGYCSAFVRANHHKLVNASASVSRIARDLAVSENQVARRITKRLR